MKNPKSTEPKSGPLERYVAVLEAISSSPNGLTARELEVMLDLPKTTTNRLLGALAASDLIKDSNRRGAFAVGPRLARVLQSDTAWIEIASKRLLKALAADTGETCFVARLFGASIQSVVMESPDASVGVYVTAGHVLPPHATATGKLLTAFQEPRLRAAILETALSRLTSRTVLDHAQLEKEYEQIRQQGYAIESGEHIQGLSTLACPISLTPDIAPIYALGLTGPTERIEQNGPALLQKLKATAEDFARVFTPRGMSTG
jgi:DNA-binding IclR family transcriptional regulator